jgi:DNA-binding NarL/FixJ family response regulator
MEGAQQVRKLRVVVVDDSEVVRMKLRGLIEADDGLELVGEASSGEEGLNVVSDQQPDVAVMDLRMPGMSGIEATWQLGTVAPSTRVLVLTVSAEQEDVTDAIMAGARGYVVKGAKDEEITAAVRGVAAGERVISPQVAGKLVERVGGGREGGKAFTPSRAAPSAPRVPTPAARTPTPAERPKVSPARSAQPRVFTLKLLLQTLLIAVILGALLTMVWQGEQIQDGDADSETWIKAGLTVLAAFALVNIGVLVGRSRG